MEEIAKFQSRKEWENFVWQKLLENIRGIKSKKDLGEFLDSLMSEDERKMVIKRLLAISLLKQGKTYKEIGEILWLSPNTISAIKKSIGSDLGYRSDVMLNEKRRANNKLKRLDKIKIKPSNIFDYWANFPWPKMVGKGRWRFLNYHG